MKKKLPVSKFILIYWVVIAVFAVICPLFRFIPKGQTFYLILNAIAIGAINYLAVDSVVWTARRTRYIEFEELKTSLITDSSRIDTSDMATALKEDVAKYLFIKRKQNAIDLIVVILAAALVLGA